MPTRIDFRTILIVFALMSTWGCAVESAPDAANGAPGQVAIALHGGAGTILRSDMTPQTEAAYREKLEEALQTGYAVLKGGGSSLDAVVAAIQVMEESPLFNSGVGAVFTSEGTNELDASIMDGQTLRAGAVAGVKHIRSPIAAARMVMEHSPHVMMTGDGAETFARENGLEMVENDYFYTDRRFQALQRAREAEAGGSSSAPPNTDYPALSPGAEKFGTVGVVALDASGNLAAGTSTGGMTNKKFGRVGDSPIIGAGTYADNVTAAISATGHGEYFIRGVISHDIASRMRYAGEDVDTAARTVIMEKLTQMGGTGGVIAMDGAGNISMPFNTEGMYRGYIDTQGRLNIEIYGEGDE